jgi:hypothetical protein
VPSEERTAVPASCSAAVKGAPQGTVVAAAAAAVMVTEAIEATSSPSQRAVVAAGAPVPQGRVSQLIVAAKAAQLLAACTPEETALRAALLDSGLPGGCRYYPVHCNGLPGLMLLPRNCELSIRVSQGIANHFVVI